MNDDKEIIDYKNILSEDIKELDFTASYLIKEGWQPYGYLITSKNVFIQTMVKFKSQKKPFF